MRVLLCLFLLISVPSVLAHGEGAIPSDISTHWNLNVLILVGILLPLLLYMRGMGQRVNMGRAACFVTGLALLFVALISPVDALGASLFSGHMVQHLLLVLGAGPLLVLSQPMPALLRGLPLRWGKVIGRVTQSPTIMTLWERLTRPVTISLVHIAALYVWHIPALYSAAVQHEVIHALEHASFFGTALLYWYMVREHHEYGSRVLSVFIVMMASGVLGALMTFSRVPWYGDHAAYVGAWGLTLLEDQQLAGLFMWVPASLVYVVTVVMLLGSWINTVEHRVLERESRLAKDMSDA
jgi:putative membrane protein